MAVVEMVVVINSFNKQDYIITAQVERKDCHQATVLNLLRIHRNQRFISG